jgi:hypothetical protein
MAWVQPLDLESILVNNLSGSSEIFIALAIITISGAAAFFHMDNILTLIMLGLFFAIMSVFAPVGSGFLLLGAIVVGLLVYFTISRIVKY